MPITDSEIKKALEEETEKREESIKRIKEETDVLKAKLRITADEIDKLTKEIDLKKKSNVVTKEQEDRLRALKQIQDQYNGVLEKTIKGTKNVSAAQKEGAIEANQHLQLTRGLIDTFTGYIRQLDDVSKKHTELSLALSHATAQTAGFTQSLDKTSKDLADLRSALSLTRKEHLEFLQVWTQASDLGIDLGQVKELGKQLRELRGHAQGMKELKDLMAMGPEALNVARGGGTAEQRVAVAGAATRDQRMAMQDIRRVQGGETQGRSDIDLIRQKTEKLADVISASFGGFTEKFTAYWGPGSAIALQGLGQLIALKVSYTYLKSQLAEQIKHTGLLNQIAGNTARSATNQAGPTGILGKYSKVGGKIGGGLAIGGMIAGVGGEYLKQGAEPGGRQEAAGAGLSAGGGIAGMAGTGAMLGAAGGPVGAIIGGIIGAGAGLIMNWGDVKTAFGYLAGSLKEFDTSIEAITQRTEGFKKRLEEVNKQAQIGLAQATGRTAEMQMGKFVGGGSPEDTHKAIWARRAGARASIEYANVTRQDLIAKTSGEMGGVERDKSSGKIGEKEYKSRMQALGIRMEELKQEAIKALDSLDFSPDLARFTESQKNSLRKYEVGHELLKMQLEYGGLLSGDLGSLNKTYEAQVELAKKQFDSIQLRTVEADRLADHEKLATRKMMELKSIDSATADERNRATQNTLNIAKENLKLEKQRAEYDLEAAKQARISNLAKTGTGEFRVSEVIRGGLEATAGKMAVGGMSPQQAAQIYGQIADEAQRAANVLSTKTAPAIESLKNQADAAKVALDQSAEGTQARMKAELNYTSLMEELKQKENTVINANKLALQQRIRVIEEETSREVRRIDVQKDILSTQLNLAEYLGTSYSEIFSIQGKTLALQIQGYEITRKKMVELAASLGDGFRDNAEYQNLQKQSAKESAEITKASIGRQRDFLDKALGRAFGVGSGSKFQPLMTDRGMFGQNVKGPAGMMGVQSGTDTTIYGRQQAFGGIVAGASRPMAPIGGSGGWGGGGGLNAGMGMPGPVRVGSGGGGMTGATTQATPTASASAPVVTDISGLIRVEVSLKSDILEALVDSRITLRQKRGGV